MNCIYIRSKTGLDAGRTQRRSLPKQAPRRRGRIKKKKKSCSNKGKKILAGNLCRGGGVQFGFGAPAGFLLTSAPPLLRDLFFFGLIGYSLPQLDQSSAPGRKKPGQPQINSATGTRFAI